MRFCTNCGKENSADSAYCAGCGNAVAAPILRVSAGVVPTRSVMSPASPKIPKDFILPSVILMVVGLGLNSVGWLFWDSYFGSPIVAAWLFWLTGSICWVVSASLSWVRLTNYLGATIQIVGFVGLCVLTLGFLVGSFSQVGHFIVCAGFASMTVAIGLWAIPRALRH